MRPSRWYIKPDTTNDGRQGDMEISNNSGVIAAAGVSFVSKHPIQVCITIHQGHERCIGCRPFSVVEQKQFHAVVE